MKITKENASEILASGLDIRVSSKAGTTRMFTPLEFEEGFYHKGRMYYGSLEVITVDKLTGNPNETLVYHHSTIPDPLLIIHYKTMIPNSLNNHLSSIAKLTNEYIKQPD